MGTNDHDKNTLSIAELSSLKPGDLSLMKAKPDHTIYLGYDFYKKDNPIFHHPGLYGFNQGNRTNKLLIILHFSHFCVNILLKIFPTCQTI